jgi:hypothetical protein
MNIQSQNVASKIYSDQKNADFRTINKTKRRKRQITSISNFIVNHRNKITLEREEIGLKEFKDKVHNETKNSTKIIFQRLKKYGMKEKRQNIFEKTKKIEFFQFNNVTIKSHTSRKLLSFENEFPDSEENEIEDSDSFCSSKTNNDEFSSKCFGRKQEEEEDEEMEEEEEFELVEPMVFDLVRMN